jgi:hypothetical protein
MAVVCLMAATLLPGYEDRVISKASQYAPQDLKLLFRSFEEDFRRGLVKPPAATPEALDRQIAVLIQRIKRQEPMALVVEDLSAVARGTVRLLDPALDGRADPLAAHIRKDFPRYMERRLTRFPVVFYGFDNRLLRGDALGFLQENRREVTPLAQLLRQDYSRTGKWADFTAFDDQSTAFGVAQVTANRAFSAVLNVWYYVWTRGGGRWGPLKPALNTERVWLFGYGY